LSCVLLRGAQVCPLYSLFSPLRALSASRMDRRKTLHVCI
jgi:hypothetical protein